MMVGKISKRSVILAFASATVCISLFLFLYFSLGKELLTVVSDRETFRQWLESLPIPSDLAFVLIRAFQTVIKIIPAEPLEIGSGYIWGTWGGFAYCMIGTEIGSLIIILLTKIFGIRFVNLFADVSKINEWSFIKDSKKRWVLLFIIYVIPGTPKDLITYFIGLTDIKIIPFLLITGIARIPAIISSTYCGNTLVDKNYMLFAVVFAVITVVSAAGTYIGLKYLSKFKKNC